MRCFNPRPSLLAGEPFNDVLAPIVVTFQSTPVIAGGRTASARRQLARHTGFNPRPSLLAGELSLCNFALRAYGFNPRPSLLAGEHGCITARR